MGATATSQDRVVVDGKGFRLGGAKFFVKGVTYGPFAPTPQEEPFPNPDQVKTDFELIRLLGANLVRVYYVPPRWFLDLAASCHLKVMVDIPWPKHLCFMDSEDLQCEAHRAVRQAVLASQGHPAIFAFSVVNEVPTEIVRWSGARRIQQFIEQLVVEAKQADPGCLCTFANFPPTEFVQPENLDFLSFNVYLHDRNRLESYLARLQMVADSKPLILAEFGMDSLREGEARQADFLSAQIETAFRSGLAGTVVFSFTDDWFRGGQQVQDWALGLTTRERKPKRGFAAVQRAFEQAPYFPLPLQPRVSVVVASYNGARTLPACLDSLDRLNYPDYEVILVDDGSRDNTQEIARQHPRVRCLTHSQNQGLSAARNTGIMAATGEIVAFTDADCRADEDWLYYLVGVLESGQFAGVGGHNLLPPEDSLVATAVMASPGGPAHVMLTDRQAEHLPGCNMAFHKSALMAIGGFDSAFRQAGDDVDICWRLQEHGFQLGFSPAGFVWHYRRSTVRAYLSQQRGYGEAEALLARKHPEYFTPIGHSIWRGRIYAPAKPGVTVDRSVIYHGLFGGGFFQRLYRPAPSSAVMFCTSLEYHVLATLPLAVLSVPFPVLWPLAVTSFLISLSVCALAGAQATLVPGKTRFWSRSLVALLFFLQPIVRGFARYRVSLTARSAVSPFRRSAVSASSPLGREPEQVLTYWSRGGTTRYQWLQAILKKLETDGWQLRTDTAWTGYDLEIMGSRWSRLRLITVTEELNQGCCNFRCRLVPQWSLLARVALGTAAAFELVLVGFLASVQPWTWMILLTLPVLYWLLEHQQWTLLEPIAFLVGEVSTDLGFCKVAPGSKES